MVMIETLEALENLDSIANEPGIDVLQIGSMDMTMEWHSVTMGPPCLSQSPAQGLCRCNEGWQDLGHTATSQTT